MNNPTSQLDEAIEKAKAGRRLILDEQGNLIMKQDLTRWERVRIFLNRWWVFALLILALSQVAQTVISVLKYFRCQ
jgi:hypothetical protein